MSYTALIAWAVALVLFLVVEGITAQLVTIWFAAGALAGLITAYAHGPVWLQIVMFVVVSGVTLAATRPLVKRITGKKKQALNADRIIGSTAVVTETVDNLKGTGCVKVSGVPWTARSADDSVIETGKSVSVEKIEGVKVIVKEI